jgi:hypothetical protein
MLSVVKEIKMLFLAWVASEKIHGANFSIHCSGQTIRYGRRKDFLTD